LTWVMLGRPENELGKAFARTSPAARGVGVVQGAHQPFIGNQQRAAGAWVPVTTSRSLSFCLCAGGRLLRFINLAVGSRLPPLPTSPTTCVLRRKPLSAGRFLNRRSPRCNPHRRSSRVDRSSKHKTLGMRCPLQSQLRVLQSWGGRPHLRYILLAGRRQQQSARANPGSESGGAMVAIVCELTAETKHSFRLGDQARRAGADTVAILEKLRPKQFRTPEHGDTSVEATLNQHWIRTRDVI